MNVSSEAKLPPSPSCSSQQQHRTPDGCEAKVTLLATVPSNNQDASMTMAENDKCTTNWSRFSEWVHCICVVTFDLNLGQALELVYPPCFMPTEQEMSNICYMAFPDSNSGCMGDTKFHMRLRIAPTAAMSMQRDSINVTCKTHRVFNNECIPVLRADQSHYWGFVYFRQKRDANLPRGYFQKSFIIISRLPFFNLFYDILAQLAPKYFNEGNVVLHQTCHTINSHWPQLQAGVALHLQLYDHIYQVLIPKTSSRKANTQALTSAAMRNETIKHTIDMPTRIIVSVNELELFHSLGFVMEHLYTLWELVLVAEPIVVVGTSPADCSHTVQTLVALIAPLEYCAEARPYFTIHDTEFKEFIRECGKTPPPVILGVTNPYFIKLLKNWPHMLRLVDNQLNIQQQQQLLHATNSVTSFSGGNLKKHDSVLSNSNTGTTGSATSTTLMGDGSSPGLYTKHKPFLKKDKTLIKKVMHGMKTKRPEHVQTALFRRHLLELTQSFMIPLERYIASLMPLQKDISPFKSAPNANAFKLDDFLATLELSGPHLTSPLKGDWKGLYRRFFNSANFRGWYESRHRELQLTLQDLQLQALSEANLEAWAKDKQEVEIIDMILKLKQKLNLYTDISTADEANIVAGGLCSNGNNNSATNTRHQIRAQIDCIKALLPPDLKNVINL